MNKHSHTDTHKLSPWPNFGQFLLSLFCNYALSLGLVFGLLSPALARIVLHQFSKNPPYQPCPLSITIHPLTALLTVLWLYIFSSLCCVWIWAELICLPVVIVLTPIAIVLNKVFFHMKKCQNHFFSDNPSIHSLTLSKNTAYKKWQPNNNDHI